MGRGACWLVLSLALFLVNYSSSYAQAFRLEFDSWLTPLKCLVASPKQFFFWAEQALVSQHHLIDENQQLKTKNLLLDAKVQRLISIEQENKELKAMLSSASTLDQKVSVATLLLSSMNATQQQIVINLGSSHSVYVGQPVLDAYGVMGQVIARSKRLSQVLLLTDSRSRIPVKDQRNGLRTIVAGQGYGQSLSLLHADNTGDWRVGDLLLTSGLGLVYPAGYPVGRITKISQTATGFARVLVEPMAHLDRSSQVMLVWNSQRYLRREIDRHSFKPLKGTS